MNNSFARLIDGMCETLRVEVLTRLDDDFARGQVYGVINLLNTFKVRGDWSAGFLVQQIEAQVRGLQAAAEAARSVADADGERPSLPDVAPSTVTMPPPITALLAARDANNRAIAAWVGWLDAIGERLGEAGVACVEAPLREAMRAEVDLELRHAPRPLFAEMSSGREG
jgi:hypothetical protein